MSPAEMDLRLDGRATRARQEASFWQGWRNLARASSCASCRAVRDDANAKAQAEARRGEGRARKRACATRHAARYVADGVGAGGESTTGARQQQLMRLGEGAQELAAGWRAKALAPGGKPMRASGWAHLKDAGGRGTRAAWGMIKVGPANDIRCCIVDSICRLKAISAVAWLSTSCMTRRFSSSSAITCTPPHVIRSAANATNLLRSSAAASCTWKVAAALLR